MPGFFYLLVYLKKKIWWLLCAGTESIQNYTGLGTLFRCLFNSDHRAAHEKPIWKILLEKLSGTFYLWREIKKQFGVILSCYSALDYRWLVLFLPRTAPATLLWGLWWSQPCMTRSHRPQTSCGDCEERVWVTLTQLPLPKSVPKPPLGFGLPGVSLTPSPAAAVGCLAEWKEALVELTHGSWY